MGHLRSILELDISRFFLIAFAAYLLNFSIDSQDPYPDDVAENLAFNDIESFYEFFTEALMGIEDAVEEHEERDMEEGGSFSYAKFLCPANAPFVFDTRQFVELGTQRQVSPFIYLKSNFSRNVAPPPEG
ncbi:MAG: hypothetical protein ACKO96_32810 [Flammeovirgaceae bacterium]